MKRFMLGVVVCTVALLAWTGVCAAATPTVKQLYKMVLTQKKQIAALQAKTKTQGTTIATLTANVSADRQSIATLTTDLSAARQSISTLTTDLSTAKGTITSLTTRLDAAASVLAMAPFVTVDQSTLNGLKGPHIIFQGVNVHVRDGSGATNCNPLDVNTMGTQTGLGNLIIGYDETSPGLLAADRSGSNNLVLGIYNRFSGAGCLIDCRANRVTAQYAAVSGGVGNTASAEGAVVSGGISNTASAMWSAVSGGIYNVASNYEASVSGGWLNTASGQYASVSGGYNNLASGSCASITGGSTGTMSTQYGWAAGGAFHNP